MDLSATLRGVDHQMSLPGHVDRPPPTVGFPSDIAAQRRTGLAVGVERPTSGIDQLHELCTPKGAELIASRGAGIAVEERPHPVRCPRPPQVQPQPDDGQRVVPLHQDATHLQIMTQHVVWPLQPGIAGRPHRGEPRHQREGAAVLGFVMKGERDGESAIGVLPGCSRTTASPGLIPGDDQQRQIFHPGARHILGRSDLFSSHLEIWCSQRVSPRVIQGRGQSRG